MNTDLKDLHGFLNQRKSVLSAFIRVPIGDTMKIKLFAICLFALVSAAARAQDSLVSGVSRANYPRMNGSTSTRLLGELLAARALGLDAAVSRFQGDAYNPGNALRLTFSLRTSGAQIKEFFPFFYQRANHRGTPEAYDALLQGAAELILVARLPSPDELKAATARKISFDAQPIGRDALVILVNHKNRVASLKTEQVRAIYENKSKLWRELGGADLPVLRLVRDRNSGSQELLESLVMKRRMASADKITRVAHGQKIVTTRGENAILVTEMGEVIERVAERADAIAPSVWYYEKYLNHNLRVRVVPIDGIAPDEKTLADGTYPLVAPIYAVTRRGLAPDSPAARVRDWLLSGTGQKLVADAGFVRAREP